MKISETRFDARRGFAACGAADAFLNTLAEARNMEPADTEGRI